MSGGGCKARQAAFVKRPGESGYASCILRIEGSHACAVIFEQKPRFDFLWLIAILAETWLEQVLQVVKTARRCLFFGELGVLCISIQMYRHQTLRTSQHGH